MYGGDANADQNVIWCKKAGRRGKDLLTSTRDKDGDADVARELNENENGVGTTIPGWFEEMKKYNTTHKQDIMNLKRKSFHQHPAHQHEYFEQPGD